MRLIKMNNASKLLRKGEAGITGRAGASALPFTQPSLSPLDLHLAQPPAHQIRNHSGGALRTRQK